MYLKIIEARFSRIKSWELQAKLWPIWIWKADLQFTLSAFSRYHQMGKRSDLRLPQGKDVCKKKTRVAGDRLREGPGFCSGNTNKHATFHTFFRLFLRSQWSLLKGLSWGNTTSLPSSSRWQPVLQKIQADPWSYLGEISFSIYPFSSATVFPFRYPSFRKELTFLFGTEMCVEDILAKLRKEISSANGWREKNIICSFLKYTFFLVSTLTLR